MELIEDDVSAFVDADDNRVATRHRRSAFIVWCVLITECRYDQYVPRVTKPWRDRVKESNSK